MRIEQALQKAVCRQDIKEEDVSLPDALKPSDLKTELSSWAI
jgi:hypothetical protein